MSNIKEMTTKELLGEKKQIEEGFCGNHIPLDIKETIGEKEPDKIEEPKELDEAQIMEIVQKAIASVIEKAQGKI